MHPAFALAKKDLTLLRRDKGAAFFTLVFPVAFAILFGLIFAGAADGPTGLRVTVVDLDDSPVSRAFADRLGDTDAVLVDTSTDEAAARELVARGSRAAVIVVPEGFGASIGDPVELFAGGALLRGHADPSRGFATGVLQGVSSRALVATMIDAMQDPETVRRAVARGREAVRSGEGLDPGTRLALSAALDRVDAQLQSLDTFEGSGGGAGGAGGFAGLGVSFEPVAADRSGQPRSAFDLTIPQGNAWALMACVVGFGTSLAQERARGTMTRLLVAPIRLMHVLAGKAIACAITAVVVQVALVSVGVLGFGVVVDDWLMLAAAVAASAFAFTGIMTALSAFGRTEGGSEGFGRAVLLVLALFGGGGVPLAFMPEWMRTAAGVSPFKWAITAVEQAVWRGASWSAAGVSLLALAAFGVGGFAIGVMMFRRAVSR